MHRHNFPAFFLPEAEDPGNVERTYKWHGEHSWQWVAGQGWALILRAKQFFPDHLILLQMILLQLGVSRGVSRLLYPDITVWQAVCFPDVLALLLLGRLLSSADP